MAHGKTSKRSKAKTILRLVDLEQSKNAVLHSLGAASSQESYGHAIDEFIGWYCSEPRLAFNRTVVLRYRFFLEQKNLAPSTINVRLAAVRRLAYEASDTGLLSPDLAAGIRRVKGAKRLGMRIGNWLTVGKPLAADGRYVPKTDISVPIRWTRPLPWAGRGYKHAERFRVLLLLDLSTPEDSCALCGIWADSKSFLPARSHRADQVGPAGDTADCFDRNVRPDSDLI